MNIEVEERGWSTEIVIISERYLKGVDNLKKRSLEGTHEQNGVDHAAINNYISLNLLS